jgi:hypothetical protein
MSKRQLREDLAEAVTEARTWQACHKTLEAAVQMLHASRAVVERELRAELEALAEEADRRESALREELRSRDLDIEALNKLVKRQAQAHESTLDDHAGTVAQLKEEIAERRVRECRAIDDGTVLYPQIGLRVKETESGRWSLKIGNRTIGVMHSWADAQLMVNEKLREAVQQALCSLAPKVD